MPLLRYRPCLPYTLQRYVSDVWLSLCFLLISLSSSPFLLWPHPRNIRGCVLIYDFSLCTIFPSVHLLAYSPRPFYLPLPIRPSLQLAPPYSPLSSTTGTPLSALFSTHPSPLISPPTYSSPNLSRLQLTFLQLILLPTHLKRIYDTGIIEYPTITKMYLRVG